MTQTTPVRLPIRRLAAGLICLIIGAATAGCGKPHAATAKTAPAKSPPRVVSRSAQPVPVAPQPVKEEPAVVEKKQPQPEVVETTERAVAERVEPEATPATVVAITTPEEALAAAEQALVDGNLKRAEEILLEAIDTWPDEYRTHELYGEVLALMASDADTRRDATRLATSAHTQAHKAANLAGDAGDEVMAGLHHRAGELGLEAGLTDDPLVHFQSAGTLDPSTSRYPFSEAQLLLELGRLDESRAALQRVLAIDPDHAMAYALLAEVDCELALRGIHDETAGPEVLAAYVQQSRACHGCGRSREALDGLMTMDARSRSSEVATAEIAEAYRVMGEPAKVALIWQIRYMRHPDDWRSAARASEAWLKAGALAPAQWWFEKVRRAAPEAPEVRELGRALASYSNR